MRSLGTLALAVAAIAFTLGVFEIGLRLAGFSAIYDVYSKPSLFWRQDPLLGWSHEPGSSGIYVGPRPWPIEFETEIHINSLGLRGPEVEPLPEDGFRILLLGDSVVAAFEVPYRDTFGARAQRLLDRAFPFPVQVINAGVRGYGTDQSHLYYRDRGRDLEPDLVVLVHSENDVRNNMTLHRMRRPFGKPAFALSPDGGLALRGSPVPDYPLCSAVSMDPAFQVERTDGYIRRSLCAFEVNGADHSALFTVVSLGIQRSPSLLRWLHDMGGSARSAFRFVTPGVAHASETEDAGIDLTVALIRALSDEATRNGAGFLLFITNDEIERLGGADRLDAADVPWRYLYARLYAHGPEITFRNDSHWNAYGHEVIGEGFTKDLAARILAMRR